MYSMAPTVSILFVYLKFPKGVALSVLTPNKGPSVSQYYVTWLGGGNHFNV